MVNIKDGKYLGRKFYIIKKNGEYLKAYGKFRTKTAAENIIRSISDKGNKHEFEIGDANDL